MKTTISINKTHACGDKVKLKTKRIDINPVDSFTGTVSTSSFHSGSWYNDTDSEDKNYDLQNKRLDQKGNNQPSSPLEHYFIPFENSFETSFSSHMPMGQISLFDSTIFPLNETESDTEEQNTTIDNTIDENNSILLDENPSIDTSIEIELNNFHLDSEIIDCVKIFCR